MVCIFVLMTGCASLTPTPLPMPLPTPPSDQRDHCRPVERNRGEELYFDEERKVSFRYVKMDGADARSFYLVTPAEVEIRGVILFTHGITEHAYRWFGLAKHWAEAHGIQTILPHLAGHGHASDEEELTAYLAMGRAYASATRIDEQLERVMDAGNTFSMEFMSQARRNRIRMKSTTMSEHVGQLRQIAEWLNGDERGDSESQRVPFLMAGHSLGGLITLRAGYEMAIRDRLKPRGVAVFSPALRPNGKPLERPMLNFSWASHHSTWLSPLGSLIRFPLRSFSIPYSATWTSRHVSSDEREVKLHADDPLILDCTVTPYLLRIEELMVEVHRTAAMYPAPVCIVAAKDDRIVDTRGAVQFRDEAMGPRDSARPVELHIIEDDFSHDLSRAKESGKYVQLIDRFVISQMDATE